MKDLFQQIETLTPKLQGWATPAKAANLAALVVSLRPEITVEIGVFGGRSFLPMVLAHKFINRGIALGIEPWSRDAAAQDYTGADKDWWGSKVDLVAVHNSFMHHVRELKLEGSMSIMQLRSDDVKPPDNIGLLHVDGNHAEQAVRDVKRFAPKVKVGGVCVMDDLNWSHDGPKRALVDLMALGFSELYRVYNKPSGGEDDYGVFQRVK